MREGLAQNGDDWGPWIEEWLNSALFSWDSYLSPIIPFKKLDAKLHPTSGRMRAGKFILILFLGVPPLTPDPLTPGSSKALK